MQDIVNKPLIASFDVATMTGVCVGRPGEARPFITTWNLRGSDDVDRPRRLSRFYTLCTDLFHEYNPDIVRYEAPMPLAVMYQRGAREEVLLMLRGAIGVLEAASAGSGIHNITSFNVQSARQHFVGRRTFPKGPGGKSEAKAAVIKMCKLLGFEVANDNEADAVAGWHYSCSQINPLLAMHTTPLFKDEKDKKE
jgi:Holliday junction resolvasome RuvABC endonuclease subunit